MPGPGFGISDGYQFAADHGLQAELEEIQARPVHPKVRQLRLERLTLLICLKRKASFLNS
jgi:hypothetical protein